MCRQSTAAGGALRAWYNRPMEDSKRSFIEALFRQNGQQLVRFLSSRLRDPQQADEIAQEAYLRMQKLHEPEQLDNARAFLFQVAANMATDQLRRQQLHHKYIQNQLERNIDDSGEISAPLEYGPDEQLIAQERVKQINAALDSMKPKPRQAFLLHRRSGLSYSEIAEEMGVSVSSVEKYILAALKHFRDKTVVES